MSSAINTQPNGSYSTAGQLKSILRSSGRRLGGLAISARIPTAQVSTLGSTVSLSSAGVGLLEGLGNSIADVAKGAIGVAVDAIELPYDVATDVAGGILNAAQDVAKASWDLASGGAGAFAADAGSAVRSLLVDAPLVVASDVEKDAKSDVMDASTLASGVLGLASFGATGSGNILGAVA